MPKIQLLDVTKPQNEVPLRLCIGGVQIEQSQNMKLSRISTLN